MVEELKRGDIVYIDLGQHPGSSIQSGLRPCLIVSNNRNNKFSTVINVLPFSAQIKDNPVHVIVRPEDVIGYFDRKSDCLIEQIVTVDKKMIISKVGCIKSNSKIMKKINSAIRLQLGLTKRISS